MKKAGRIILTIAGVALIVVLLRSCVATSYLIPSAGMENSLYQGERILVNKWSYGLRLPFMNLWGYHRWGDCDVGKEDILVFNNPANRLADISRREVFISRCIGLPGDTLLVDSFFTALPCEQYAPDQKFVYAYPKNKERQLDTLLATLSIRHTERMGEDSLHYLRSFSRYEYYLLEQALYGHCWIQPAARPDSLQEARALIVPKKGRAVRVYPWNRVLLCNTLVLHEHRNAKIQNDTLYVDGRPVQHCVFTKDYYWVASNNAANVSDSRLFGFVPEDHLIGRASVIWFSRDKESGMRWDRIGKAVR